MDRTMEFKHPEVLPPGALSSADKMIMTLSKAESQTSISSCASGPEGFKQRKVQLKDGYLIVSDVEPADSSVMGDPIDEWEHVYLKHRKDIVDSNLFIYTPLHIVKEMAKQVKQGVHIEHYIIRSDKGKIVYRVDIMIGTFRGVGQCTSRQMARQLAAIDLYEKIQLEMSKLGRGIQPLPRSALLPGWRVHSMVMQTLFHDVCRDKQLEKPRFIIHAPPHNSVGKFTAICRVGEVQTKAQSDLQFLAIKLAAKEMYEKLTGSEFPLETTHTGENAISFPEMKQLGFNPAITDRKRKWIETNRVKDEGLVYNPNEPNDGAFEDMEMVQLPSPSKRVRFEESSEGLKVTVSKDPAAGSSRKVFATASASMKITKTFDTASTSPTAGGSQTAVHYRENLDFEGWREVPEDEDDSDYNY